MIEQMTVPTEGLVGISKKASDVVQKTTEAVGTLKMIDSIWENGDLDDDMIWALRNSIRSIESATNDSGDITDAIEQFGEMQ